MRARTLGTTAFVAMAMLCACGPSGRKAGAGNDIDAPGSGSGPPTIDAAGCVPTAENTPATCSDGIDNNCNGLIDCADPSCSGIGQCPVCGMVEHPTGAPIDLPDGVGLNSCTTDADCAALQPGPQHCFDLQNGLHQCRQSYVSKVHFSLFGSTQKVMQTSDIVSVCVNMSHEWIRDLEIALVTPDGRKFLLDKFEGQQCPAGGACEVYLGHPINTDGDCSTCSPEAGMQYCWTPGATKPPILGYADMNMSMQSWQGKSVEPPDNYAASDPWTNLVGATLNGDWSIVITDLWPIDAGKLHSWAISFNPAIVQNCTGPVIQ